MPSFSDRWRKRSEDDEPSATPWLGGGGDPDGRRAQDWLDSLEAEPAGDESAPPEAPEPEAPEPEAPETTEADTIEPEVPVAGTKMVSSPLLADLEERIASAERRAAAAEGLARDASARAAAAEGLARTAASRAFAAAARSEDILFALPDLARDLKHFVDADEPGTQSLIDAIERMRARVTAAVAPPGDNDNRVIVIPD